MTQINVNEKTVAYFIGRELANSVSFRNVVKERAAEHYKSVAENGTDFSDDASEFRGGYFHQFTNDELISNIQGYCHYPSWDIIESIEANPLSEEALGLVMVSLEYGLEQYGIYTRTDHREDGMRLYFDEEFVNAGHFI